MFARNSGLVDFGVCYYRGHQLGISLGGDFGTRYWHLFAQARSQKGQGIIQLTQVVSRVKS